MFKVQIEKKSTQNSIFKNKSKIKSFSGKLKRRDSLPGDLLEGDLRNAKGNCLV